MGDVLQLVGDVFHAVADIPSCLKSTWPFDHCPTHCYDSLYQLRDSMEKDSGKQHQLLEVAHLIGFMADASQQLCNDFMTRDWIASPDPRPPFDTTDLMALAIETTECLKDVGRGFVFSSPKCFDGCFSTVSGFGQLVEKYVHVSVGQFIQEMAANTEEMCMECQGVCFAEPEGSQKQCSPTGGRCHHGVCREPKVI